MRRRGRVLRPHTHPSDAYLAMLGEGLREPRGWSDDEVAAYFQRVRSGD